MQGYYITADSDGTKIDNDARMQRVSGKHDAIARLQDFHVDEVVDIAEGHFGDAFAKFTYEPTDSVLEDLSQRYGVLPEHLIVQPPGTHPGGRFWGVQITQPGYVAVVRLDA